MIAVYWLPAVLKIILVEFKALAIVVILGFVFDSIQHIGIKLTYILRRTNNT